MIFEFKKNKKFSPEIGSKQVVKKFAFFPKKLVIVIIKNIYG